MTGLNIDVPCVVFLEFLVLRTWIELKIQKSSTKSSMVLQTEVVYGNFDGQSLTIRGICEERMANE